MNCPRCGAEQRPGARFCARCGAPLPASPPPAVPPTYIPSPQAPYTPVPSEPPPIISGSGAKRASRLWIYIVAGGLGMILLGVIAAVVLANVLEFPSKGIEKKVEEGIKIVSTKVGDIATEFPTLIPTISTSIATVMAPLTEGTRPALPPVGETLMAPFFSATATPGSQVIEWFSDSENYQVEIQDGKVISGSGQDSRFSWEATEGTYNGRFLVVTFLTRQRNDCLSEMTYTYEVEEERLVLVQSVDKCSNTKTYNDRYYNRRQ